MPRQGTSRGSPAAAGVAAHGAAAVVDGGAGLGRAAGRVEIGGAEAGLEVVPQPLLEREGVRAVSCGSAGRAAATVHMCFYTLLV